MTPYQLYLTCTFLNFQVFYAITKLVLQTKKDSAKDAGGKADTFRVGGRGGSSGSKKGGKCC